jgi:hypothetical protein
MKIILTSVMVDNQEKTLKFYTEDLGPYEHGSCYHCCL